jgi:hypothetical protein
VRSAMGFRKEVARRANSADGVRRIGSFRSRRPLPGALVHLRVPARRANDYRRHHTHLMPPSTYQACWRAPAMRSAPLELYE